LVENFIYPTPTAAAPYMNNDYLKSSMPNRALASNGPQPSWTLVSYTSSTTAYGIVTIDEVPAEEGDWVGAFVGTECRAMQQVIIYEGTAYANLQIQGEIVETISFKVWDASRDLECEVALTVQSNPGTIIGSPDFLNIAASSVPTYLEVTNTTLGNDETDCYNAQENITVAGGGTTVDFESGSFATLIAGQSIRFLPGFHAHNGSYVNAYITTTGSFCDDLQAPIVAAPPVAEKSYEFVEPDAETNHFVEQSMVVYPNPNNGQFTIAFTNFEGASRVYLFNAMGQKVYAATVTEQQHWVELPNLQRGIYFVKAINGQKQFDQKVVIQ